VPELRENEQKTLLALEKLKGRAPVEQIVKTAGLAHSAVMRASLSLTENKLTRTHEKKQTLLVLSEEGKSYAEIGLPERRLLDALGKLGGEAKVGSAVEEAGLEKQFMSVALGWLNRKGWATIMQGNLKSLKDPQLGDDEKLLQLLSKKESLVVEDLGKELRKAVSVLKGRKLVETEEKTLRELELTDDGWNLVKKGIEVQEEVSQLTPELIRTGSWRKVKLRRFNVEAPGPEVLLGKVHPAQQIIQHVREIF
jgi:phenylalanyl-tRNA synthetase alpha chain